MDFSVDRAAPDRWILTDLLGRTAGRVEQQRPGMFRIVPAERYGALLREVSSRSFETLDQALTSVETATRGACRLAAVPPVGETSDTPTGEG